MKTAHSSYHQFLAVYQHTFLDFTPSTTFFPQGFFFKLRFEKPVLIMQNLAALANLETWVSLMVTLKLNGAFFFFKNVIFKLLI